MTWQDRSVELRTDGHEYGQIVDRLRGEYPKERFTFDRVRGYLRRHYERQDKPKRQPPEVELVKELDKGATLDEIADKAGVSSRVAEAMIDDLSDQGYCVDERNGTYKIDKTPHAEPQTFDRDWNGDKTIRFGLLGDTQINSKFTQITHLHTAYDAFKHEGITDVYHSGDIDDGEKMRRGHEYELYNQGLDDHVSEIVRVYPKIDGITTRFIIGNHDESYIKAIGTDIGKKIAEQRVDMEYLGQDQAYINLTPTCIMELRHPQDGTAYAISYKMQKMIEAMSGGEKPNILAVGHYHKQESFEHRNVQAIQTGCLQAQTGFMRGKGIAAIMGYYIIEIKVDDDGQINEFLPRWRPFYKAIKDDYKNWI